MQNREEVKQLWKRCFDDSDEFVEMYFRLRYSEATTVVARSEGKIVSALQMPSYPVTFGASQVSAAYISGACTHPGFRGKGLMAHLLAESFDRMLQNNVPLSFLIPANPGLYDFYARIGYAPAFFRSRIEQSVSAVPVAGNPPHIVHTAVFDRRLFDYFTGKAHCRPNYVQHTPADFEAVMDDLRISGGSVAVATTGHDASQRITGILFAVPENGYLNIPEWFADDDSVRDHLIRAAAHHHHRSKVVRFEPPAHPSVKSCTCPSVELPFGMARIIHAPTMLGLYAAAHLHKTLHIHLTDAELPFNNGYYNIDKGTCTFHPDRSPDEKGKEREKTENEFLELDARALNAQIFNDARLYMSLMLE